jgi:Thioredoxin like C-terminal domain
VNADVGRLFYASGHGRGLPGPAGLATRRCRVLDAARNPKTAGEPLRRRLAAILTADIAGYSRLMGQPSYAGITAETYVGAARREPGTVRLEGNWQSSRQYVELRNGTGRIVLPFTAGEVNLVVHPGPAGKAAIAVLLDGKPVGEPRGADVGPDGVARFDRAGMIRLLAGAPRGKHVLTLVSNDPGLQAYVFTFGP